jgi:hypothetical protein
MRLIEELITPSAAAVAAVQAARTAAEVRQPAEGGGAAEDGWTPGAAVAEFPEPRGMTKSETQQMDQLRDKYGKFQRERDGGEATHVSLHTTLDT